MVLIIVAAAELPSALVCFVLVDRKEFGRKNLMALGYLFVGITMSIGVFILLDNYFMVWISGCKFFIKISHILTFQYTTEVYESNIRVTGVGAGSSISRIAGIIMPFILIDAMHSGFLYPYYIFLVIIAVVFVVTLMLPYDTTGRVLDKIENFEEEMLYYKEHGKVQGKAN